MRVRSARTSTATRRRALSRRPSAWAAVLLLLLLAGGGAGAQQGPADAPARDRLLQELRDSGRVSEALLAVWAREDRAPVVVTLDVPARRQLARSQRRARIREQGARMLADCAPGDFRLRHRFAHVPGLAGDLHLRAARRLLRNPAVRHLDLDGGGRGALAETMPLVGGYTANTAGFLGAGVTVAALDSGIDTDHPDLASALVEEHCFCAGCCPNGLDEQSGAGAAEDDNGHGTLVAGVLLSRGNAASVGMAPAASLVEVKVLDDQLVFSTTSDIVAALEWVIASYTALPPAVSTVRVVNMSLATTARFPDTSPGDCGDGAGSVGLLGDAVDELESRGVLVVAAAGNAGDTAALPAPACLSNVISVGATWDEDLGPETTPFGCSEIDTAPDQVTCFSNAPAHTKIFAPGALISGPGLDGGLGVSLGTSFSSPSVAGCAALLLGQDPLRSPAQLEALLLASPVTVTDGSTGFSFPRLDCADALGLGPEDDDSDFDGIPVGAGDNCPLVRNPMQGDVELDGVGDRCDVCVFVEDPDQADADMDGLGDACTCTGNLYWPGDVNRNGAVGNSDLGILESNFGRNDGVGLTDGDQNCDGIVDGADYTLWADHWGRSNLEADLP